MQQTPKPLAQVPDLIPPRFSQSFELRKGLKKSMEFSNCQTFSFLKAVSYVPNFLKSFPEASPVVAVIALARVILERDDCEKR